MRDFSNILDIVTIGRNDNGFRRTAESIVAQGPEALKHVRWLVVNGSSPKHLMHEAVEEYSPYMAWHQSKPDKGLYDAMNKGLEQASSRFVWFMNSGDTLPTNKTVATVLDTINANPEVDMVYGGYITRDKYHEPQTISRDSFQVPHHQSTIYNLETLGTQQYSARYPIAADYELTVGFLEKCKRVICVNEAFVDFEGSGVSDKRYIKAHMECFLIRQRSKRANLYENALLTAKCITGKMLHENYPQAYTQVKALYHQMGFGQKAKAEKAETLQSMLIHSV